MLEYDYSTDDTDAQFVPVSKLPTTRIVDLLAAPYGLQDNSGTNPGAAGVEQLQIELLARKLEGRL